MESEGDISHLVRRLRNGDEVAARLLVERFGLEIRAEIRYLLRQGKIRRLVDSEDVCQSVLGSFFVRLGLGEFQFERAEDLAKLLLKMKPVAPGPSLRKTLVQPVATSAKTVVQVNSSFFPTPPGY